MGGFGSIFSVLFAVDLIKVKLVLNNGILIMIGCKDYITANLLECLNRELITLRHRTTEVLFIPVRGVIVIFAQTVIPFCHNILRCLFKGIKDMLGVVLKATGHCAVDAGDDEHLGVLKKGGVAGSIF